MKQSAPYFSSMSFRKSVGIFSRPLSSTRAGACPMRTLSSIDLVQRPFLPLFSTYVHKFPLLLTILILGSCVSTNPRPHRARELRGLWVATVNNGDWPSRRDLTSDQQKQELIAILDRAAAVHLNAIFLQVRPMADAFYPSTFEPWSVFLVIKRPITIRSHSPSPKRMRAGWSCMHGSTRFVEIRRHRCARTTMDDSCGWIPPIPTCGSG